MAPRLSWGMPCVLFLDDDHERHWQFRTRIEALGYRKHHRMLYVFSAAEAIEALDAHAGDIVQAFLDHDLSEDDILIEVGAPSKVPTGMTVVDHILTMPRPPAAVVVHSYNHTAAVVMCARLGERGTIDVKRIPFSQLLAQLA
jgi:CheY-like chemotaxis protein